MGTTHTTNRTVGGNSKLLRVPLGDDMNCYEYVKTWNLKKYIYNLFIEIQTCHTINTIYSTLHAFWGFKVLKS